MGFLQGGGATVLHLLGGPASFSPAVRGITNRIAGQDPLIRAVEGPPQQVKQQPFSQLAQRIGQARRLRRRPSAALFQQQPQATARGIQFTDPRVRASFGQFIASRPQ